MNSPSIYKNRINNLPALILVLLLFLSGLNASAQLNTERMIAQGRNALFFEDYIVAIQKFNSVITVKPHLSEPYFYRAVSKYYLEDFRGCIADCQKTLSIDPFNLDAYNLYGIALQKLHRNEESLEVFNRGLEVDNDNTILLTGRGVSHLRMGIYEEAIQDYNEALRYDSKLMSAYVNRGIAYFQMGDTTQALNDLTHAIEINSSFADAYGIRGIMYSQKGEFQKALDDYNQAISLNQNNAGFYNNRALAKYQLNDIRGALDDYDEALEIDPNSPVTYYNRGLMRAMIGADNDALEDFNRVIQLEPGNYMAYYNRGLLRMQTGNMLGAISDFDRIIEQYPDFPDAYLSRAQAKRELNNIEGAEKDRNTAFVLNQRLREDGDSEEEGQTMASAGKSSKKEENTRKKSDSDIQNYKKVVVLDNSFQEEDVDQEVESLRGKIQNRNFAIDLEPIFTIGFFTEDTVNASQQYYSQEIENFNQKQPFRLPVLITNSPNRDIIKNRETLILRQIEKLTRIIKEDKKKASLYFYRGIYHSMLNNLNDAIEDYNKANSVDPDFSFAYLNLAAAHFKRVELIRNVENMDQDMSLNRDQSGLSMQQQAQQEIQFLDYEKALENLDTFLEINPDFPFAYFNRGVINVALKNYKLAVEDFTRAVELNPEFAEAYFNRGLTLIFLGEREEGNKDLSKSGELGLYKAYNIIKRYGTIDPQE